MRASICLALCAACAPAAPVPDDPVTVKPPQPHRAGERVRTTTVAKFKQMTAVEGIILDKEEITEGQGETVYVDEIVTAADKPGGHFKLERTFEKYKPTGVADVLKDDSDPGPPLNTPVAIERLGDAHTLQVEGKELRGRFADQYRRELHREERVNPSLFFPPKPLKVGGTWTADAKEVFDRLENSIFELDRAKATAGGRLVKVYGKGGRTFATFEFVAATPAQLVGPGHGAEIVGGRVEYRYTRDGPLDGRPPWSVTTAHKMSLRVKQDGVSGGFDVELVSTTTTELLPKK